MAIQEVRERERVLMRCETSSRPHQCLRASAEIAWIVLFIIAIRRFIITRVPKI